MEYRVLGSLEVLDASGQPVPLGGTRQRTVLGSLLLRAGETVPLERLVDELDYELEARNQIVFADFYRGHPYISVPEVVPQLCTRRRTCG